MEVDQGDLESERLSAPKNFFAGTSNFNQRPSGGEDSKVIVQSASTEPIDFSPIGAALPTVASPQVPGPSGINPKPPPPPVGRTEQNSSQADAMAIRVEKVLPAEGEREGAV